MTEVFKKSVTDSNLFFVSTEEVLIYVGDILLTETSSQSVQCLVNELNCQFALKDLGKLNYYLGFKANRNGSSLHLS